MNDFEKLSKKALYCWYLTSVVSCLIICCILGIVLGLANAQTFTDSDTINRVIRWICLFCMICSVLSTLISPLFRYRRYSYRLTDTEVQIKEGYLFLTHTIVPISRLHKIEITSGPFDRFFGLSSVEITTAGGDVTIQLLEQEQAEHIAENLKTRINELVEKEKTHGK